MIKMKRRFEITRYISLFAVVILIIIGTFLSDRFLQVQNVMNILQYASETGLVSIGMTFVILSGGIDLSVGSVMGIGNITGAMMISAGNPVWLAVVTAIAFGAGIGLVNGLLITKTKLEPFIVTLVTMTCARSVVYFMSNGAPIIRHISDGYKSISQNTLGIIPYPVIYMLLAYLIAYYILKNSVYGRHLYAIGGSLETALLFGIRADAIRISVYIISGALAGFAGIISSSRLGMGDPNSGLGYEMAAITIVVVGGASMAGGSGSIFGTFFGMMLLSILKNLLQLNNVISYIQPVIEGTIIILVSLLFAREIMRDKIYGKKEALKIGSKGK